jgi:hypothetical protein
MEYSLEDKTKRVRGPRKGAKFQLRGLGGCGWDVNRSRQPSRENDMVLVQLLLQIICIKVIIANTYRSVNVP